MADYPYLASNKNIAPVFEKIRTAAKPAKFTIAFVKQLGFTSSNDSAYPSLLKRLGFLTDDGTPTSYYDKLRDSKTAGVVLADRIKDVYSELYTINTEIHNASESDIKGAISRVTGKDAKDVGRIYTTFKALCNLADFNSSMSEVSDDDADNEPEDSLPVLPTRIPITAQSSQPEFHYNIQIHLPATTDISVYNAIFKSIKEHLL